MSTRDAAPAPAGRSGAPTIVVRLQIIEQGVTPPACGRLDRDRFRRRTLRLLRQEFGEQLAIEYQTVAAEGAAFVPKVLVQEEMVSADGFPSQEMLRFVIARHLALEHLLQALLQEGQLEAVVQGFDNLSWQDALLALASRRDPL